MALESFNLRRVIDSKVSSMMERFMEMVPCILWEITGQLQLPDFGLKMEVFPRKQVYCLKMVICMKAR